MVGRSQLWATLYGAAGALVCPAGHHRSECCGKSSRSSQGRRRGFWFQKPTCPGWVAAWMERLSKCNWGYLERGVDVEYGRRHRPRSQKSVELEISAAFSTVLKASITFAVPTCRRPD